MRIKTLLAVAAATAALGTAAQATEFVTNGGFENATPSQALPSGVDSYEFGDTYKYGQAVDGWTSTTAPGAGAGAFNVYFASGASAEGPTSPDTRYTSSEVQYLWSVPGGASPAGGAFVALDGDVNARGILSQTINGLTVGNDY